MSHSKNPKKHKTDRRPLSQIPCTCTQEDGMHEWNCARMVAQRKREHRQPPPPITPPARYCPRCEGAVVLRPPTVHDIYDCQTCETLLFESEVDTFPGQTKGKQNPHAGK